MNLPLAPPAGVRALTTKGPSAAATNRHACNPCPPSFCQPASCNGRSGDSQGVLATASVAVSSARGPSVRFPHARGREWALVSNHRLSPPWGDEREGPLRPLSPRKGTRVGNHPGLGTDGPLPSASDPAKGPTAISSQATQGKRTPGECWPQLAGLRASPFTPDPCSRGERICRANRAANRAKMLTEEGGEGGPKPMPLTLNYRWRGSNGYTQPWMKM